MLHFLIQLRSRIQIRDARDLQIFSLLTFLSIGISMLEWEVNASHMMAILVTCLSVQFVGAWLTMRDKSNAQRLLTLKSALITTLSLCVLLRAESGWTLVLASVAAIGSKFVIRANGKHLFNPANIGIIVAVKLAGHAWISPAQWGNDIAVLFMVATAGLFVLMRVQRLDVSMTFLGVFFFAECLWNCLHLGWSLDFVAHKFTAGSLYLFAFFMITDPKTTPDARFPRIVWTASVALLASALSNVWYMNASPLWALVLLTPLTPLVDKFFPASRFDWDQRFQFRIPLWRKSVAMLSIVLILFTGNTTTVNAFCGFYAARADIKLLNKSSQVILVRDGEKTIVTMESDFKGDVTDFAIVIPVPNVPRREDIRIIKSDVFDKLDGYSTPRLAEYFDHSPCEIVVAQDMAMPLSPGRSAHENEMVEKTVSAKVLGVKIEAEYTVGEYDIVILSAEQPGGLMQWLAENGYKIPPQADEVLEPYIKNDLKFFVAKVNLDNFKMNEFNKLRPLQITYTSARFMLPIRLGMANSNGAQDLTIYAFSKKGHIETVNYRTVKIPTDKDVPVFTRDKFSQFYSKVFSHQYMKRNRSTVFMEYAWDLSPRNYSHCDPCAAPPPDVAALLEAGVHWAGNNNEQVYITRLHVRYTRDRFPQDLILQETFNRANYQVRYVVHTPSTNLGCDGVNTYLDDLRNRREDEVDTYESLTGLPSSNYAAYISEFERYRK